MYLLNFFWPYDLLTLSYDFDFEIRFRAVSQRGYILEKFFLVWWFSMACRCAFWIFFWPYDLLTLSYDFDFEIRFRAVSQRGYTLEKFFLVWWFSMACRCAFWKQKCPWPFNFELWLWLWSSFPGCESARIHLREFLFGMVIQYGL